jgi:flagellum-specific peptidoglycan hydrolase FlgJ
MTKADFFNRAVPEAIASGHLFPEYAACEAALESEWGESELARAANNLFGQKQGGSTEHFEVIEIPTREYNKETEQWYTTTATWPKFPDWEWSFRARMTVLQRAPSLYGLALAAKDGETFVREVSRHWATDPKRAEDVLATYRCNIGLISNAKALAKAAKA